LQLSELELARNQGQSIRALKQGSDALKKLQKDLRLHDIMSLRQEMGEAEEYFQQVQAVLGESWTSADDVDVARSLEGLQAEIESEEISQLPSVPQDSKTVSDLHALPTVPQSRPEGMSYALEA